ncbi:hypothetical protein E308F_30300 [Moorella sp. E308F]|uniref:hypothetical protein n=1 Tax=Moorella sp. E308F TaxID=2572682 RepID=UPI0010FFAA8C|nr:hypothetical protein [Moorella sp. E308F]GEA16784.1 hypothetical protein E308F_30300 [Moorella sp. E308F]
MYRLVYAFDVGDVRELVFEAEDLVSALTASIDYFIKMYGEGSMSQLILFSVFNELLVGEREVEH